MGIQLLMSFIASSCFGIIFNTPKKSLVSCGISGMLGWFVYSVLMNIGFDAVFASLAASFFVAIISQVFSKLYRMPMIIFSVSGIIPLVPGGMAYNAMRHFVQNDYSTAVSFAAKASMISGAIAIGLIFSEIINQMIRKSSLHPTNSRK